MHDKLKQDIKQKLLTKNGNINSAILRRDWFKQSELYKSLFDLTSFLSDDSPLSERIFCILNDITESPKCVICNVVNKPFSFVNRGHYCDTCSSPSCRTIHSLPTRHTTLIERYGSLASDKHRESARNRAGELFSKGRQTFLEKYGTVNVSSLPHVKEQKKGTTLENYGVLYWSQGTEAKERTRQQRFEKYKQYDVKQIIDPSPELLEKHTGPNYRVHIKCSECNTEEILPFFTLDWRLATYGNHCGKCLGINNGSAQQQEVFNFIQSIIPDATQNNWTTLQSMELDILIPSLNIVFEYDGIYWHSYNKPETSKQKKLSPIQARQSKRTGNIFISHMGE